MGSIMVTVCIQNDSQTVEKIFGTENGTLNHSFFGVPNHHSIAK